MSRASIPRGPFELSRDVVGSIHILIPPEAWRSDAFALQVTGDCMAPLYSDGDYVVCWPVFHHSEIEEGHPAAVILSGGHRLLKQVYHLPEHPNRLVLRCRHRRKFPKDLIVHPDDVVSIARAVYRIPRPGSKPDLSRTEGTHGPKRRAR